MPAKPLNTTVSTTEATSERSLVTVLVVDTIGSTDHIAECDPDDAQDFLDRIFECILGSINGAYGHLLNFSGDGGVGVFGWPDSLEDHADMACRAAMQIVARARGDDRIVGPDDKPARFRVGIHSGLVGLRKIDFDGGSRLDTVGGTVHLASALEKRAPPNGIFVSSKTLELCRAPPGVERVDDIAALRKIGAQTFLVTDAPARDSVAPTRAKSERALAGRQTELGVLRDAFPGNDSPFRAVALVGEPGIGKSRLLAEALADGAGSPHPLWFHATAHQRTTPFAVFEALIADAMRRADVDARRLQAQLLEAGRLPREDQDIVLFLLRAEAQDADRQSYQPTQAQISRVFIEILLHLTAGEPTVVAIEDFHLLDPESRASLLDFTHRFAPRGVSLFMTARPEAAEALEGIVDTMLRLEPLSTHHMNEIADTIIGDRAVSPETMRLAVEKADGIPFVLEQILLSMRLEGPAGFDPLPISVESLIHARLNRLSMRAKRFAQSLSVLGEKVDMDIAERVLDADRATLETGLSELTDWGFLWPVTPQAIRFRHAILAEACATTLSKRRRRALHQQAVQAIIALHRDLDGQYELLAFHAQEAGDLSDALEYLWRAGLRARRNSAMGSLQMIFDRALDCIDQLGEDARSRYVDFVLMAGTSMLQIGEFSRTAPHFARALEIARLQDRPDKTCGTLCQLATIRWFEGRFDEGLTYSRLALTSARQLNSIPHIFAAQLVHALLLWITSDVASAIRLLGETRAMLTGDLEFARLGATAVPSAMVRVFLAWTLMDTGHVEEALASADEAKDIAERADDPYAKALADSARGACLLMLGRDEEARGCLSAALIQCDRNGYDTSRATVLGHYSVALARTGEMKRALETCRRGLAAIAEGRSGQVECFYALNGVAEALLRAGETAEGLTVVDRAIELAERLKSRSLHCRGLATRIRLLEQARPDAAQLARDRAQLHRLAEEFDLDTWL